MEKDFTKVYSRSSFESLYFYVSSLKVSVSDLRKKNKGKVTPRDLEIEVSVSDLRNKFDGGLIQNHRFNLFNFMGLVQSLIPRNIGRALLTFFGTRTATGGQLAHFRRS